MEKNHNKIFYNSIDRLTSEISFLKYYISQIDKYSEIITRFYIELTEYNAKFMTQKINILSKKKDPLYTIGLCIKNVIGNQISVLDSIHKMSQDIFEPMKESLKEINQKISEKPQMFDIKYNTSESEDQIRDVYNALIKYYGDIEKKITECYIQKKYNKRIAESDPSIKLEGENNVIESVRCLEGTFANFKKTKVQNLAEGMKDSNDYSKEIIIATANSVKNYFDLLKNNYINVLKLIDIESKNIDDLLKCDFLKKLSSDLISDEFGFLKYEIKVINNRIISIVPPEKDNNDIQLNLNEEDVYNIVKEIYDYNFKLVNKKNYDLEEEYQNVKVVKLANKLLFYEEGESENKINLSNDEIDTLYKLVDNYKYLFSFVMILNNYRSAGKYEISKKVFDVIINIFIKAFEYLTKNENRQFATLLIILSQTFYYIDNGEKRFLQKDIKKLDIFKKAEFWSNLIQGTIEDELEKVIKDEKRLGINVSSERRKIKTNELVFLKITPYIYNLKDFEVDKEKIREIINPFIEKYITTRETTDIINSLINN